MSEKQQDELTVYLSREEIELLGTLPEPQKTKAATALLASRIIMAKMDADLKELARLSHEIRQL
jgi:hypothetical protein